MIFNLSSSIVWCVKLRYHLWAHTKAAREQKSIGHAETVVASGCGCEVSNQMNGKLDAINMH